MLPVLREEAHAESGCQRAMQPARTSTHHARYGDRCQVGWQSSEHKSCVPWQRGSKQHVGWLKGKEHPPDERSTSRPRHLQAHQRHIPAAKNLQWDPQRKALPPAHAALLLGCLSERARGCKLRTLCLPPPPGHHPLFRGASRKGGENAEGRARVCRERRASRGRAARSRRLVCAHTGAPHRYKTQIKVSKISTQDTREQTAKS